MREIVKFTGIMIGGIFVFLFIGYLFISFILWLFNDPLHLVKSEVPFPVTQNPDVAKCREMGGYPDTSVWDGSLKECKKFELK